MKSFFSLLLLFVLFFQKTNAQDTIIKTNGDVLLVKVMEINEMEIKYKSYVNLDGPMYVVNKNGIKIINYANGIKETISAGNNPKQVVPNITNNSNEIRVPPALSSKIEDLKVSFGYKNEVINEQQMQTILVNTKSSQLIGLIQKSQQEKRREKIVYAAVPLGIGAGLAIPYWIGYAVNYNNQYGTKFTKSERNKYGYIACFCVVGTIVCPITAGIFSRKRKQYNSEAIRSYNLKY